MKTRLENLGIGNTTVILGTVVTRWTKETYEVDTWGKTTMTAAEVLAVLEARNEPSRLQAAAV